MENLKQRLPYIIDLEKAEKRNIIKLQFNYYVTTLLDMFADCQNIISIN